MNLWTGDIHILIYDLLEFHVCLILNETDVNLQLQRSREERKKQYFTHAYI